MLLSVSSMFEALGQGQVRATLKRLVASIWVAVRPCFEVNVAQSPLATRVPTQQVIFLLLLQTLDIIPLRVEDFRVH
jgi:hypothetical protein